MADVLMQAVLQAGSEVSPSLKQDVGLKVQPFVYNQQLAFEVRPQGGTLADTGYSDYYVPYNTYYHDNRLQFVILAAELQAAGMKPGDKITAVKFRCGSSVPGRDLVNFRIRIQNTDLATSTSWVTTGWTLVYGPTTVSKASIVAHQWYQHNLDTSFTWDGRNLFVDVSRDDTAYTSGGGNYIYSGLVNRACGTYHDSSVPWPYDSRTPSVRNYILQTVIVVERLYLNATGEALLAAGTSLTRKFSALLQGDSAFTPYGLYVLLEAILQSDSQFLANTIHLTTALKALLQGDSTLTARATRERLLQALLRGESSLSAEMHTAVVILVLNYLLSVADQLSYRLSAKDLADFKMKVADVIDYVLKMGGGGK